ncbi:MAG: SdpI family protein [Pseudomonadota bacterium]
MNDKKIPAKHRWISLLFIAAVSLITALVYPHLSDAIPVHWNLAGEVDGWMNKPWGALILPLTMVGTWLLFEVLSFISPKGFKLNEFIDVVGLLMTIIIAFLAVISLAQIAYALGYQVAMTRIISGALGLLLLLTGNYFGKLRKNFFIGIRTPWTLANEEVWNRTHRLAGWLFVLAGLVLFISAFLTTSIWLILPAILIAALVPAGYSLWIYKRIEG